MKRKPKKDYLITPVRLSPEMKKRVRLIAAEKDTSMADMAGELLNLGLSAYEESLGGKKAPKTAKGKPAA